MSLPKVEVGKVAARCQGTVCIDDSGKIYVDLSKAAKGEEGACKQIITKIAQGESVVWIPPKKREEQ